MVTFPRAVISLLPKPPKDPHYLDNWRPIALLNNDYKIGAKCLANRLKRILNILISPEQTGFMKGRYIGENVRVILDAINYCNTNKEKGALIFLDYEKAFDCLDWNFIINTLHFMNFGPDLINWVRTFYSNVSSCIINNGYISSYFKVYRGSGRAVP